jgi:localization factor PodJL
MPSSDRSKTLPEPAHGDADWLEAADRRIGDAIADMQERLAQLGRLAEEFRAGLPAGQAGALGRIEQGIATLTERIAAFDRQGEPHEGSSRPAASGAPADLDDPWDVSSAEALMRAYEMAEAELASAGPRLRAAARPEAAKGAETATRAGARGWLEGRLADIAALLQHSLADSSPTRSLAALDRRLDQFERRLDAALHDIAASSGRDGLDRIEAHVKELAGHFEAICRQLARLDVMDGHLRELMQAADDQRQQTQAVPAGLTGDTIAALVESAAERAVARLAAIAPAGPVSEAETQKRIAALEGLVQDYIAERRRSEDVTGGLLSTIEGTLTRIADRVDAIETGSSGHASAEEDDAQDRDSIDLEGRRLAEAYAAGARVLGREPPEPILDAADYAPRPTRAEVEAAAEAPTESVPVQSVAPDAQTRQELRASAMRAKLKAQAATELAAASTGLDEAKASMLKDRSTRLPKITGSHRFSLLLGVAMGLLCGTGFLIVDTFLAEAPPAGVTKSSSASQMQVRPAAGLAPSESERDTLSPQLAVEPPNPRVEPRANEQAAPPVLPQPAPRQQDPETATDDPDADQPAPARRLSRLHTGSTNAPAEATPATLSQQAEPVSNGTWAAEPAGRSLPADMGTATLRSAAAGGDAFAQFEIASRFAEGKGVAQDHKQAFAWYERAATRGLAMAQFRLGAYYERGVGTAPDRERARVWYRRAAEQGYARAMHNLAVLSVDGREVQVDYASAAGWFRKAAERGLTDSQFNLGVLCENGRGVPRDLSEAYKWYALAARTGDPVAARRQEQVKGRMDQAGIDAAEQKLAAWQPVQAAADPSLGR